MNLCSQKDEVEIIVKVDNDTKDEKIVRKILKKYCSNYKIINSDRRRGFLDIEEFCKELISESLGKVFWLLGDDWNVVAGDWASRILALESQFSDGMYVAYVSFYRTLSRFRKNKRRLFGNSCPIVSRKMYDALGSLTMNGVQNDVFLRGVLQFVPSKVAILDDIHVVNMIKRPRHGGIVDYLKGKMDVGEYLNVARRIGLTDEEYFEIATKNGLINTELDQIGVSYASICSTESSQELC